MPSADVPDVIRMLESGSTWEEIATLMYPDISSRRVRLAFFRHDDSLTGTFCNTGWKLDSGDLAEIQHLRETRHTWQQITDAKYPSKHFQQVRYAFIKQFKSRSQSSDMSFGIPSADIAKIYRLREARTSWIAITNLMYPNTAPDTVRREYNRQIKSNNSAKREPTFVIPSADMPDIARLRSGGKTWERIKDMLYPERSGKRVRAAFLRQDDGRIEGCRLPFTTSEIADIQRLLQEKKTWEEIAKFKFPGRSPMSLRGAFVRQTEVQLSGKTNGVYRGNPGPRPLEISPAEIETIKRWRQANHSWREIAIYRLRMRAK
jgi:hypothetical protein